MQFPRVAAKCEEDSLRFFANAITPLMPDPDTGVLTRQKHRCGSGHVHQSYSHDLTKGRSALRKKATLSSATTVPASVCFEPGVRETLTHLIAVRKLADVCSQKRPCSVVGIVDDAILSLVGKMKAKSSVGFVPVPATNGIRVSLRVGADAHRVAQKAAGDANIRVSDIIRTGLTLYLRKHAKEIGNYSPARRR